MGLHTCRHIISIIVTQMYVSPNLLWHSPVVDTHTCFDTQMSRRCMCCLPCQQDVWDYTRVLTYTCKQMYVFETSIHTCLAVYLSSRCMCCLPCQQDVWDYTRVLTYTCKQMYVFETLIHTCLAVYLSSRCMCSRLLSLY